MYFFVLALPAAREAYQFINDPKCKRLGMYAWFFTANVATEGLIIIKFSTGEFNEPFPEKVVFFWMAFMATVSLYTIWKFFLDPYFSPKQQGDNSNKVKLE